MLCDKIIENMCTEHLAYSVLYFNFLDTCVAVHINSEQLAEKISTYYFNWLEEEPAHSSIHINICQVNPEEVDSFIHDKKFHDYSKKEKYINYSDGRVVYKKNTGMLFLFTKKKHLVIGNCEENLNQVINFINSRLINQRLKKDTILCHSACVALNGKGILLAGESGKGKTSLALTCMENGFDFISNDRVIVKCPFEDEFDMTSHLSSLSSIQAYGIPKHPRVNPGTVFTHEYLRHLFNEKEYDFYDSLPEDELWDIEHKYDAMIEESYGKDRFKLNTQISAIAILTWSKSGSFFMTEREHIENKKLMSSLMKEAGIFHLGEEYNTTVESYIECLQSVPLFEIGGKVDFEKAALAIKLYLEHML